MLRRGILASIATAAGLFFIRRAAGQDATPSLADIRARTLAAFPYPRVTVPGAQALAEWQRLRGQGKGCPVIVGDDDALDRIAEQFSLDIPPVRTTQQILAAADKVRLPEGLREPGPADMPETGTWPAPAEIPGPELTVASDILTGKPFDRVHIVLLPTADSAEIPAYLRWGGWNACPAPEVHVALLRQWKARYGAELVGINGDTINLRVTRRPATREEALALAREQFLYCEDIVLQGTETLAPLARILLDQDWWFFWWD